MNEASVFMALRRARWLRFGCVLVCAYVTAPCTSASAETLRYAIERAEFAIRTGKSYQNESLGSVKSSEAVTVLEEDLANGWSRVRTQAGIEGWIQSKYLTEAPQYRCPGHNNTEVNKLRTENQRLTAELRALRNITPAPSASPQVSPPSAPPCPTAAISQEQAPSTAQDKMAADLAATRDELEQIKATSADQGNVQRNWFLGGALVTLLGTLAGRLLAKTPWGRD